MKLKQKSGDLTKVGGENMKKIHMSRVIFVSPVIGLILIAKMLGLI
jgi:hypothetical protein